MDYILQTLNLTKIYDEKAVVDNVSLHLKKGEIYGFLGENGAGKTTTIRMIMGLLKPTNGEVFLFGERFHEKNREILRKIGTIIEYPGFYGNLHGIDNLRISGHYMGMKDEKAIQRVLSIVDLEQVKLKKVKNYSLGMKQRLGIARSLLHNPELLLLDEPTNGLDPAGIKEIRTLLIKLAKEHNKTILVSSHILSEVQQVATRIGIIHAGKLLEESDRNELEEKYKKYVRLRVNNISKSIDALRKILHNVKYEMRDGELRLFNDITNTAEINRNLIESGIDVFEIGTVKETLEDYFMNIIGGE